MLYSQSSVDDCTELTIKEYLRACCRGIGPTACKDSFDFPVLFPFILEPPTISLFGVPVSPIHILVLNVWWVTREIETSAARAMHVTVDRTARVVTWLLPASKRDPYAAGEARSHGCACVTERSPACPYHAMIDYLAILVEKFGDTFNVPSRSLPLFPDGFGNTLTKSQVVSSYRETLRKAGVSTTKSDGKGIQRERFRGHVCRVTGAVWLYATLKELYLVQLFARWGSMAVARYVQDSPLLHQHEFAAQAMQSFSIQQVRKQLKGNQNQISDLAAIRDAVYKTANTVPPADSELLLTVQRRLRALEVSVGTDAPCVRNIASPKTRQGCVHRIDQAKFHYTVCGWQYNLAAHVRLASEDANRLPESQLCEICWHAGNSDTHSDSSCSSSSCSSSSSSSSKTV